MTKLDLFDLKTQLVACNNTPSWLQIRSANAVAGLLAETDVTIHVEH